MKPISRPKKGKKGISSILGTVIVLAITIALGAMLYAYSTGMFGTMTQTVNVNAQASILVNPSTNQALLSYTFQNTGNVEVNISSIVVNGQTISTKIVLIPGQTVSNVTTLTGNFTVGTYYTVVFQGQTAAHKPFTQAINVLASETSA